MRILSANLGHGTLWPLPTKMRDRAIEKSRARLGDLFVASHADVACVQELDGDAEIAPPWCELAARTPSKSLGVAVYSRVPSVEPAARHFSADGAFGKGFAIARVTLRSGAEVDIVSVHLSLTSPAKRQAQLGTVVRVLRARGTRFVVIGDFNEPRGSVVRRIASEHACESVEMGRSFPAPRPLLAIDRAIVSSGVRVTKASVLVPPASDHHAVVLDVDLAA